MTPRVGADMGTVRCFLTAWITAWVVAIYLPSVLIAYSGISAPAAAIGTGFDRLAASSWKVADDVGPVVKLTIGAVLLVAFVALERARPGNVRRRYFVGIIIGISAMLLAVLLVPVGSSRGFAVALTGARFDSATWPLYLLGGASAGAAFVLASDRCRRRAGCAGHDPGA